MNQTTVILDGTNHSLSQFCTQVNITLTKFGSTELSRTVGLQRT